MDGKRQTTLVMKLEKPIGGYWDYGKKDTFEFRIESRYTGKDSKGTFVRVGSWQANNWFYVAQGKTDKQTLANARRRLLAGCKRSGIGVTFEYKVSEVL